MLDILGKTLKNKYVILGLLVDNDYMTVYEAVDSVDDNYLVYRLKTAKHINIDEITYNQNEQLFLDAKDFLEKNKFDLLPVFDDYIKTDWEHILILKKHKGDSLSFFMSNSLSLNCYHAYMILEPLFNLIEVATIKKIYIKLDDIVVCNNRLKSNDVFNIYDKTKDIVISLALIYYKLATGLNFNKYNCHNVGLPKNVVILLSNTISNKTIFNNASDFVIALNKAIKSKQSNKQTRRIIAVFATLFVIFIIFLSTSLAKKSLELNADSFTDSYSFDERKYYYEGNDLTVYANNIYLNSLFEDDYSLMRIAVNSSEKFTITKNIGMEYLVVINDLIYYSNADDNGKLYSIGLDGSNNMKQTDYSVSYIQKDSTDTYLYFVSEDEKEEIVYKYNLSNKKRENYIHKKTDQNKYLLFIKANRILNERLMDDFNKLNFEPDLYGYNYRGFEEGYLFFDLNNDEYVLNKIDKDGNTKINPFNIKTYSFEVYNNLIYYADYVDGTLYSYDYNTGISTKIYNNCIKLYFVNDHKIVMEYDDNNQYKLLELLKNPQTQKFDIVNEINSSFNFDIEKSF